MTKGKKTSSEKIVSVVMTKIANPDLSTRDITEETGVSKSSVARVLEEELGQLGTLDKTKELYEMNLEIINVATAKVITAMKTMTPEKISEAKEMQSIVDIAFKQNQLLQGKNTEQIGVSTLSEDEQKNLLKILGK